MTKMGERGQVVIPQEFRESMRLRPGQKFTVMGEGNTLMLRKLEPPIKDFKELLRKGHERARKLGFTEQDMWDVIARVRRQSKK